MACGPTHSIKLFNAKGVASAGCELIPTAECAKNTRWIDANDTKYDVYTYARNVGGTTYYLSQAGAAEFDRLTKQDDYDVMYASKNWVAAACQAAGL